MRHHLLLLPALLCGLAGTTQVTNNGVFFVSTATPVSLGDVTNNGSFTNNGTTHVTGNFTNNQAGMPAGAGTVVFDGTTAQTLSGSGAFRSLNVTMNNAAGLVLTNRLSVGDGTGGTLTFTAGRITSGTSTQDVYFNPGAGYTGFSATSHIKGYTTKSGSTDFVFPIGDGTHTAAIGISGLSGTSDFQTLYTGAGFGNYAVTVPLIPNGIFPSEWWDLARTAGTASARVTLNWDDARKPLNHTNPGGLVVAHFSGSSWTSAGGTSGSSAGSGTGSVGPSNPLSSFSPFTFGSTTIALPIILSDFTAVNENCTAYLSWTTSLEQNAARFDVQQSADGTNFTTVTSVNAADAPGNYHTTVAQTTQQAFYRLRLVDLDGGAVYSNITGLTLTCLPATDHLSLYPNPVTTGTVLQARLAAPVGRGTAQLQVFDGVGRKIYSVMVPVNAGSNGYTIPAGGFAKGIYSVVVIGEGWKSDIATFER